MDIHSLESFCGLFDLLLPLPQKFWEILLKQNVKRLWAYLTRVEM